MEREPMQRHALFALVWSMPVSRLARPFGMSDRGFSKRCARENIPLPPRGYWAKLAAGRTVTRPPLPPVGRGRSEWVWIGPRGSTYGEEGRAWLKREIPGWDGSEPDEGKPPAPPEFDFDLHVTAYVALQRLGPARVRVSELRASLHPEVQRLLASDRAAGENGARGEAPVFRGRSQRRRLAFLNAFLFGIQRLGADGRLDDFGQEIEVRFPHRDIRCSLRTRVRKPRRGAERQEVLSFQVMPHGPYADRFRFDDDRRGQVEDRLRQICCAVVLAGEMEARAAQMQQYRSRLKRFEEELREAQRRREEACEAARNRLIEQARAHRDATDIRRFVRAARRAKGGEGPEFVRWERWALEEADAIDPLVAGQFDLSAPDSGGASLLASPYAMTSLHSYE